MERTLLTCRATMTRAALLTSILTVALAPSIARAQMQPTILEYGDRDTSPPILTDTAGGQPVSGAECEANTPIRVQLTMVPTSPMTQYVTIDVWTALSSGTAPTCQTAATRNPMGGSTSPCEHVEGVNQTIGGNATLTIDLPPQAIFATESMPDPCAASTAQTRTIFLFPAPGPGDIMTEHTNYATITVTLDPEPPAAPVIDGSASGDVSIDVGFEAPTEQVFSAQLYVDPNGCPDGTPASSTLVAGAAPTGMPAVTNEATNPSSISVSGEDIGLDYGESAAVAVTFVDRARNESVLSNVVCVTRVQVPGFWDSYCAERGLSTEECSARYGSCAAAAPGVGARGSSGGIGLVIAAIALAVARRRRNG